MKLNGLTYEEKKIENILTENLMYDLHLKAFLLNKKSRKIIINTLKNFNLNSPETLDTIKKYIDDKEKFDRFIDLLKTNKKYKKEITKFIKKMFNALVEVYNREQNYQGSGRSKKDINKIIKTEFKKLPFYSNNDIIKISPNSKSSYEITYISDLMPKKKGKKLPYDTRMTFTISLKQKAIIGAWIGVYYPKKFNKNFKKGEMGLFLKNNNFPTNHISVATCLGFLREIIATELKINRLYVQDPRRSFWMRGMKYKLLKRNIFKLYPEEERGVLLEAEKIID